MSSEYISYGDEDWFTLLGSNRPPRPWLDRAACFGLDPKLWYPNTSGPKAGDAGKQICRSCPVRLECLQYALDTEDEYGTHGGVGELNRRDWFREGLSAKEMIRLQDSLDGVG